MHHSDPHSTLLWFKIYIIFILQLSCTLVHLYNQHMCTCVPVQPTLCSAQTCVHPLTCVQPIYTCVHSRHSPQVNRFSADVSLLFRLRWIFAGVADGTCRFRGSVILFLYFMRFIYSATNKKKISHK